MAVSRRQFMKVSAAGLAASSVGALGFTGAGEALAAGVRPYKLERATETRNTCPYCSVSCGVIVYSLGDKSKNTKASVIHIEGDPDHPVNRGTLCPRGAASLDYVHSPLRLKYPMHRKAGSDKFERVIPKGRGVAIEEVVDAVCFLARRETGFITGQEISINGGSAMP